ncbi:Transposase, partial [mine drainage metagenome]
AIRARAKRAQAEIDWGDEMGVRSDQAAGRGYRPRGQTPVMAGTGQRLGGNPLSALTHKGRLLFMVF